MTDADALADLITQVDRTTDQHAPLEPSTIVHPTDVAATDELDDMTVTVAAASRHEPGKRLYTVSRRVDGLTFYLHDRWGSVSALATRQQSAKLRSTPEGYGAFTKPGSLDVHVLTIVDEPSPTSRRQDC